MHLGFGLEQQNKATEPIPVPPDIGFKQPAGALCRGEDFNNGLQNATRAGKGNNVIVLPRAA